MKNPLAEYFEKNFLTWQLEHGRSTVEAFAQFLGVSKGYMSGLMNGKKTQVSPALAFVIASRLDDYEILDILGYARPDGIFIPSSLPSDLRERLRLALDEISSTIRQKSLDPESDEAIALVSETFAKYDLATISARRIDGSV